MYNIHDLDDNLTNNYCIYLYYPLKMSETAYSTIHIKFINVDPIKYAYEINEINNRLLCT